MISLVRSVCDEPPPAIRQLNPEIPPWLAGIVEKLLAKDPVDRFQSAAEVAAVLSQGSTGSRQPAKTLGFERSATAAVDVAEEAPSRLVTARRQWLAAGALLVVGGLILAEAIGLTSLREFLSEEPNVPRPHDPPPPPVPSPVPQPEEILVFGPRGGKPRVFQTLAQAIPLAKPDDVIEIRQNGVIPVHPMRLDGRPLTIRAGQGFRPVLTSDREDSPLISTDSRLVLEGLVLRMKPAANERVGGETMGPAWRDAPPVDLGLAIVSRDAPLYLANCRIVQTPSQTPSRGRMVGISCIYLDGSPECELRNCLLLSPLRNLIGWNCPPGGRLTIQNVVGSSHGVVEALFSEGSASLHLKGNTLLAGSGVRVWLPSESRSDVLTIQSSENVFSVGMLLTCSPVDPEALQFEPAAHLPAMMTWHDRRDLFSKRTGFLEFRSRAAGSEPPVLGSLRQWDDYWGKPDAGSRQALLPPNLSYTHTNIPKTALDDPKDTVPGDFRLTDEWADFGADLDRVGPGEAYDRWRKTPDYRAWTEKVSPTP